MGAHSSKSMAASGGGSTAVGISTPFRYIDREGERQRFMQTQNPSDFTETPPDTISMNGITFRNTSLGSMKSFDSDYNRQYSSWYQSVEANQNGEYPIFRVAVIDKKTKRGNRYVFNQTWTEFL